VLDAGQTREHAFLSFAYQEGRNLRWVLDHCQKRGFMIPLSVTLSILQGMIAALAFAEKQRLLSYHLDPAGLLLSYRGTIWLRDFLPQRNKADFGLLPTPDQLPTDRYCISTREDPLGLVSFCGAICHEMVSASSALPELPTGLITNPDKVRLPQIPDPLAPFLFRALTPEPANHFRDLAEMARELEKLIPRVAPGLSTARVAEFLREHLGAEQEADQRDAQSLLRQDLPAMHRALVRQGDGARVNNKTTLTGGVGSGVIGSAQGALTPPNPLSLIDQQIGGRYRVKKLLGIGGMGWVYSVEHVEIGRTLALKVLHRDLCTNPEVVTRFRREARSASTIGHPNIVEVTDFGTMPDGSVYCVMELLNGIDLAQLLQKETRVPEARVISIGVQMCKALEAAHQAGIIHRDMKPANVFLIERDGKQDFVKVLDFGIAKMTGLDDQQSSLTRPGMTMGTPQYMAPEQAAGKPLDPRADIYAVGAILYELITGVPPFTGASVMEVLTRKLTQPPPPFQARAPGLDTLPALEALVLSCLERKADKRPQRCADIVQKLQEIAETLDDPAARKKVRPAAVEVAPAPVDIFEDPPPPPPPLRPTRSGLLLSALAGAAGLGAVAVVAWQLGLLPLGSPEEPPNPLPSVSLSLPVPGEPSSSTSQSAPVVIPLEALDQASLFARAETLLDAKFLLAPAPKDSNKNNYARFVIAEAKSRFPNSEKVAALEARLLAELFTSAEDFIAKGRSKSASDILDALAELGGDAAKITSLREQIEENTQAAINGIQKNNAAADEAAKKGNEALKKNDYNTAVTYFQKSLSLNSKNFDAALGLARSYFQQGKYAEAVRQGREATKLRPGSVAAKLILADSLFKSHDNREAMRMYESILEIDAKNVSARSGLDATKKALGLPP
jgi:serine/threonine protein kinase